MNLYNVQNIIFRCWSSSGSILRQPVQFRIFLATRKPNREKENICKRNDTLVLTTSMNLYNVARCNLQMLVFKWINFEASCIIPYFSRHIETAYYIGSFLDSRSSLSSFLAVPVRGANNWRFSWQLIICSIYATIALVHCQTFCPSLSFSLTHAYTHALSLSLFPSNEYIVAAETITPFTRNVPVTLNSMEKWLSEKLCDVLGNVARRNRCL